MARKKGRSGVKPATDLAHARELIAQVVPDDRWRGMIGRMAEIAEGDDPVAVEAARLLMSYAVAMPAQKIDVKEEPYD